MATFEIQTSQMQRWVKITIADEAVRAEAGALSYMRGDVQVDTPLPSLGSMMKCSISDEPLIRPRYVGTGEIYLASSFGGYHSFELDGVPWILESGSYWASDNSVKLGLHREAMMTSFWAGEGFIDFQTKVSGEGRVVVNAVGPVEEIDLGRETISVEGKLVIARSADVSYRVVRPTRSLLSHWLSGEEYLRQYRGPGKVLLVSTPYAKRPDLNEMAFQAHTSDGSGADRGARDDEAPLAEAARETGAGVVDSVQAAVDDAAEARTRDA
ncbi:MAG: AIM24 family protein [Alphaproteobacteria bacterium]|uniref:AIM24 family protein n=1 Tax=Aestuariivirga sp. TaxID=2650926 RepID=UPI0030183882|nr:AIM24 family protein [Alphaproteobacteria bacterium]